MLANQDLPEGSLTHLGRLTPHLEAGHLVPRILLTIRVLAQGRGLAPSRAQGLALAPDPAHPVTLPNPLGAQEPELGPVRLRVRAPAPAPATVVPTETGSERGTEAALRYNAPSAATLRIPEPEDPDLDLQMLTSVLLHLPHASRGLHPLLRPVRLDPTWLQAPGV